MIHFLFLAIDICWLYILYNLLYNSRIKDSRAGLQVQFTLLAIAWTGFCVLILFMLLFDALEASQHGLWKMIATDPQISIVMSVYFLNAVINITLNIWLLFKWHPIFAKVIDLNLRDHHSDITI